MKFTNVFEHSTGYAGWVLFVTALFAPFPVSAAVNYLVFTYSTGSALVAAPTGLSLAVTAQVKTTCPTGSSWILYGIPASANNPYVNSVNGNYGNLAISGTVCVAGVPSTVTFTASQWIAGNITLKLADAAATTLSTNYVAQANTTTAGYTIHSKTVIVVIPDGKLIIIGSYIHSPSGYYYGSSMSAAQLGLSNDLTVSFNAIGWNCNGCANTVPVSYMMGY